MTLQNGVKIAMATGPFDSPDARQLVAALDGHLASRYKPEQMFGPHLKAEMVAPGVGTFVIARVDGVAVGCGALRRRNASTIEVKRMYGFPEMRGRGVARRGLDHLENDQRPRRGARHLGEPQGWVVEGSAGFRRRDRENGLLSKGGRGESPA